MAKLTFISASTNKGAATLELEDIPDEVKAEVEEIYTTLKKNNGRMHVDFDSDSELELWLLQVKSYCLLRPEGQLYYRKSPTKKGAVGQADFRITDMPEGGDKAAGEIRQAVDNVKAASKK